MPRSESLRTSAVLLGFAGMIEFALQMAIPILLARYLDEITFAQYRLLWLLAGTALAIAPMFMPQSLFYFLSRARRRRKASYIGNVLLFLTAAGTLSALVASDLNPWLQQAALDLFRDSAGLSAAFLALWVMASMLDVLPTADGRAAWQAGAIIGLAVLRTVLLAAAALFAGDIYWIAVVMLAVASAKLLLLAVYMRRFIARTDSEWDLALLRTQVMYAFPFAIGHTLFLLRVQADQWVVVSMLPTAMYATFSVAAVILPIGTLIRQPVNNALLPRLNKVFGAGDKAQAARLIALSNGASGMLLIPVAGALFACAPELVELVYTRRYIEAAPVMRVYLIGLMITAIAVGHTLSALGHGRFAAINSAVCLALSIVLCVTLTRQFGMAGAAAGSMIALAVGELWGLLVVARTLHSSALRLINWHSLLPAILATAFALLMVEWVTGDRTLAPWNMLLAKAGVYCVAFVPVFLLAGGWRAATELAGFRKDKAVVEGGAHETA
ncbi:MAG TPA: polysaccharide biosynthesis C-terminal domain-containing protein [Noviherbaspirillum sp.]|nr:polysaccharide biosynthesis C-terminal domain-containing protein [Noviherbaspirillum sp.]